MKKRKTQETLEKWITKKPKVEGAEPGSRVEGITFVECNKAGYPARTKVNVQETDATLVLAVDVSTPGEKLTKRLCLENKKPYLAVKMDLDLKTDKSAADVALWIKNNNVKALNIAGNCLSRFSAEEVTQKMLNELVTQLLTGLSLERIQSGGQTGIDEAGAMAALALKIPAKVVAPRGWMFREQGGRDVSSEELFKLRFQKN